MASPHTKTAPDGTPERLRNDVRLAGLNTFEDGTNGPEYQVTLTVVPVGERWAMRATSAGDAIRLPGIFCSRLEALGAAVLLAERCGGTVCP